MLRSLDLASIETMDIATNHQQIPYPAAVPCWTMCYPWRFRHFVFTIQVAVLFWLSGNFSWVPAEAGDHPSTWGVHKH